jgi:ubiquitin C-terminal hydrolase
MKVEFSQKISKNIQISNFIKVLSVGAELFNADGQTDTTKLIRSFCNFVNAPKSRLRGKKFWNCISFFLFYLPQHFIFVL